MVDFNLSELRETYYSEISSLAEDYQKRIEEGEFDDREALDTDIHETIEFCAMEADLYEALEALGVDVNDDATFDREEEEEEEEDEGEEEV